MRLRVDQQPYRVWGQSSDGAWVLEGTRTKLKDAFALARKRYREYKGQIPIKVCLFGGGMIADDPSDFTMKTGARR
jgi:hypothetical protein